MPEEVKTAIQDAFRAGNLRCTPQRYAVLHFLLRRQGHPTADQIYTAINSTDPRASRATVYNNLHTLIAAGVVREVVFEAGPVRYDANIQRHHHFLCQSCGSLEDIPVSDVPLPLKRSRLGARLVREYEIVFRGVCGECARKSPSSLTLKRRR